MVKTLSQDVDGYSTNIMTSLLQGSEDIIALYEIYLKLIDEMGLQNFLTLQV